MSVAAAAPPSVDVKYSSAHLCHRLKLEIAQCRLQRIDFAAKMLRVAPCEILALIVTPRDV